MTISTTAALVVQQGNGATSTFNFAFIIPFNDDGLTPAIAVYLTDPSGVTSHLTITTDFTVADTGQPLGGSVTLLAGALAAGWFITILRLKAETQPTAATNQAFLPHTIEQIGDQITLLVQQIQAELNRALLVPINEPGLIIPAKPLRLPGYYMGFDSNGNIIALAGNGLAGPAGPAGVAGPTGPQGVPGAGALGYTPLNIAGKGATDGAMTGELLILDTVLTDVLSAGFRGFPVNEQDGAYTCVLADAGKCMRHNNAGGHAHTIPPHGAVALPLGTIIGFRNAGAGVQTVTRGAGVTLTILGGGTSQDVAVAQYGMGSAWQEAIDVWTIAGKNLS